MIRPVLTIFVALMVLSVPRLGFAVDEKTIAGSACISIGSGDVLCPLVRDNTSNTNGLSDIDVRVNNVTASTYVGCTAYSIDSSGSTVDWSLASTTTAGIQWLGMVIDDSADNGTYSVLCEMDAGDSVFNVVWEEF